MTMPQRELSLTIATLIMNVVQPIYQITDEAIDIGSWSRSTNTDGQPDIDLLFLGIPNDPQRGFVDWTALDTLNMIHTREGITQLSAIQALDPVLFTAITQSLQQMETHGWHAKFLSVRAWENDPWVVFTIGIDHPHYGPVGVDITLSYLKESFGIEHSKRFQHFLEQTSQKFGEERATQLIEDIRQLKRAVKKEVMQTGKLDRTKKVSGFVIEALFMHQAEPHSYQEVLTMLIQHTWVNGTEPELPEHIHNQEEQLIEANVSFDEVLHSVTKGGYTTLKIAASKELTRINASANKQI